MADEDTDLKWLRTRRFTYFLGTEAPDVGAPESMNATGSYKDTLQCHCVLYKDGEVKKERSAVRAQEEFDKAKQALAQNKKKLAAFYLGAMAHYIGDLSQFCHLMGAQSRWGAENQQLHARYEQVIDARIDVQQQSCTLLAPFISNMAIAGTTPRDIAFEIASFTDTGGGTEMTPGKMYALWKDYSSAKRGKPSEWDQAFLDQTGKNVNVAINGIAKLLKQVAQ